MAWFHRKDGVLIPDLLAGVEDIVRDPDGWQDVRRRVKKLRLANARRIKAETLAKAAERRRTYMRAYMARRRRKD